MNVIQNKTSHNKLEITAVFDLTYDMHEILDQTFNSIWQALSLHITLITACTRHNKFHEVSYVIALSKDVFNQHQ